MPDARGVSLDADVRRLDEDRWLASRFAEPAPRARLIAIYAVYHEIARVPEAATEPGLGAIRLQWWRDCIAQAARNGPVPDHPALQALAQAMRDADLPVDPFEAMIDARLSDFEQAPFETWRDLEAYVDATAGAVVQLAAKACDPSWTPPSDQAGLLRAAGRAWGFVGLARAAPYWAARRRTFFPAALRAHVGLDLSDVLAGERGHAYTSALRAVLDRGAGALRDCQRGARALPHTVFPAISYVSFASDYARAIMRAGVSVDDQRTRLGHLARRLKLVQATVRGIV